MICHIDNHGILEMERPYIFFHTGTGFLVFVLFLPFAVYVGGLLLSVLPEVRILQFSAVLVVCGLILWIPCWADHRLARKKRMEKK